MTVIAGALAVCAIGGLVIGGAALIDLRRRPRCSRSGCAERVLLAVLAVLFALALICAQAVATFGDVR